MESLVVTINQIQDVFATLASAGEDSDDETNHGLNGLDLPIIAVVGAQSSGKSSVLEHLVGRDFLPRGSGIVTRCPLLLQLMTIPKPTSVMTDTTLLEWGEFLHIPGKRFYDFNEIRSEIQARTDSIAGKDKGVSSTPIHLRIYSPHVLTLTFVDLPGIAKVAVGDQPEDIEERIEELIKTYVEPSSTIILAVTAANTDIANSDALRLARAVDPKGERTIGVATKLDIMDKGTDATDVLLGRVIQAKLGFVGVVGRSQADIQNDVPVSVALEKEKSFFAKHPSYAPYAQRLGTPYLARTLNVILSNHIRESLPRLRLKVGVLLETNKEKLKALGDDAFDMGEEHTDKSALLLSILTSFSNRYSSLVHGTEPSLANDELDGGARLCYLFENTFTVAEMGISLCDDLTDADIEMAMSNASGLKKALFVPEACFETLARRQIKRLLGPALGCVDLVYEEMKRMLQQCSTARTERFEILWNEITSTVVSMLEERLSITRHAIADIVNIEVAYINTSHPDFIGGQRAIEAMHRAECEAEKCKENADGINRNEQSSTSINMDFSRLRIMGATSNTQHRTHSMQDLTNGYENDMLDDDSMEDLQDPPSDIALIKILVESYFDVVRVKVIDSVPKTIMYLMVNHVVEQLQSSLIYRLFRSEDVDRLLNENADIAKERKDTKMLVEGLQRAQSILCNIRGLVV
eukprot:CFRG3999T1